MDGNIWNMIINVKYHEDTAESARVAWGPSSYKAFDKAAIGISIEQVERAGYEEAEDWTGDRIWTVSGEKGG